MAKVPVFYSFHYDNDVFRVQQIRNMDVIEGDEPVLPTAWGQIKRRGDDAVERWIDESMKYKRCVLVLVGEETANRRWVQYEIKKAYESRKGLLGVYVHNLKCPRTGQCAKGANPFDMFTVKGRRERLSTVIPCYDPGHDAYAGIAANLAHWVARAISAAKYR